MDDQARAAYEDQSVQLRAELKQWEGDWATANAGKKPGRADIKQNPEIAHKYKQYSKLRDTLAGKIPPPPLPPAEATHGLPQRKRSQSDAALPPQTPSKRSRPAQTPQKTRHSPPAEAMPSGAQTPSATHPAMTPSLDRTALTPLGAAPTSISPTPQRDGRVLGIFDLLGRTPSKPTTATITLPAATPSRPRTVNTLATTATTTPTTARFASTPKSTRTTQLLFQTSSTTPRQNKGTVTVTTPFKTPSTNRISKDKPAAATPTSSTPSFLRRRTVSSAATTVAATTKTSTGAALSRVDEQDENGGEGLEDWKSVGPLRLPRKLGVRKGLSNIVAGLRQMEEEAFGDEEEAMREMEMEMEMMDHGHDQPVEGTRRGPVEVDGVGKEAVVGEVEGQDQSQGQGQAQLGRDIPGSDKPDQIEGEVSREEGQPGGLLSGFDNEALYDSLDEEKQRYRQPLRQFKKRGQKRTTRLVNMRPTRAKRPAQADEAEADEGDEDEVDMVPETQFTASKSKPTTAAAAGDDQENDLRLSDFDSNSEIDFDASDFEEDDDDEQAKAKSKAKAKTKAKKATAAAAAQKKKAAKDAAAGGKDKDKDEKGEGVIKKAVRKVKATAHANFKRLKLRNTGTKGGPGFNSRFRRRR